MLEGSVEENTLCALCYNDRLAPELALKVTAEDFSSRTFQRIAAVALDFQVKHHRTPRGHLRDLLEHEIRRGEDGRFLLATIDQIEDLAPKLIDEHVLEALDKFLAIQRTIQIVNQASDALQQGHLEQAQEILRTPNLVPHDSPGIWLHNTDDWLSFLKEEEDQDLFSSGIDILDERGVRPARGEVYLLIAPAKRGKSWFLTNCGKSNVLEARKDVLHITLENSLDLARQRYTQSLLSLTRDGAKSLRVPIFTRDSGYGSRATLSYDNPSAETIKSLGKRELAKRLEPYQRRGRLLVKYFPTASLSFGQLMAYLDALERVENFRPDMLLLDYADLMNTSGVGSRDQDLRQSLGKLYQLLRGLAALRNLALVTVTQSNRESERARLVTANMVAEDWSKIATVDTVLTYSQTSEERELGLARILVDRARNSPDKWLASITQSYEIGQFHLDSLYMDKYLESEIQQHLGGEEGSQSS